MNQKTLMRLIDVLPEKWLVFMMMSVIQEDLVEWEDAPAEYADQIKEIMHAIVEKACDFDECFG